MPKQQFNITVEPELMNRFTKLIGEGNRAREISILIEQDCERLEAEKISNKAKKKMFEKYYKPFILKYCNGRDPFYALENPALRTAFKKAQISISEADIKLCIEQILLEGDE